MNSDEALQMRLNVIFRNQPWDKSSIKVLKTEIRQLKKFFSYFSRKISNFVNFNAVGRDSLAKIRWKVIAKSLETIQFGIIKVASFKISDPDSVRVIFFD